MGAGAQGCACCSGDVSGSHAVGLMEAPPPEGGGALGYEYGSSAQCKAEATSPRVSTGGDFMLRVLQAKAELAESTQA